MKRTLCVATLLLMTVVAHAQRSQGPPNLDLTDLQGRRIRLSDYKGKVVLLNFWATWCPPCRAEMPELAAMQRQYGSKGLQIIGITYPPQTARKVRAFVKALGINYPVVLGTKKTKRLFDPSEILPLTIVIDRDGNVRDRIEGIILTDEFEQKIKPLLE